MADKGEVVILAEKIGLPPTADGAAIAARVYAMSDEIVSLKERVRLADEVIAEKENLLALAEAGKKSEKKVRELEAENYVQRAVDKGWIDAYRKPFYMALWETSEKAVRDDIESQKYRSLLEGAKAFTGDVKTRPANPIEEVSALVRAKRDEDKELSEANAQALVFAENPKLYDAYRASVSGNGGAK